jgi:hypothetical protein
MNRIESLLSKIALKLQEHLFEDKLLLRGYTLGANTGFTDIQNELTSVFAIIAFNKKTLNAEEVFKHYCPDIPFDENIKKAMELYANQVQNVFGKM